MEQALGSLVRVEKARRDQGFSGSADQKRHRIGSASGWVIPEICLCIVDSGKVSIPVSELWSSLLQFDQATVRVASVS